MAITVKNTIDFDRRTDNRKVQLTEFQSSLASDRNIREGRAKFPTNVPNPLASVFDIMFHRPARYL